MKQCPQSWRDHQLQGGMEEGGRAVLGLLTLPEEMEEGTCLPHDLASIFTLKTQKAARKDLNDKTLASVTVNINSPLAHLQ